MGSAGTSIEKYRDPSPEGAAELSEVAACSTRLRGEVIRERCQPP